MKDLVVLLMHLMTTLARFMGPGGAKAIIANSLLVKQQLLVINRSRKRAPNLSALDRFLLSFWSLFLSPHHIARAAVIIKRSTLLRFHEALKVGLNWQSRHTEYGKASRATARRPVCIHPPPVRRCYLITSTALKLGIDERSGRLDGRRDKVICELEITRFVDDGTLRRPFPAVGLGALGRRNFLL